MKLAILVPLKGFDVAKSRLRRGGVDHVDDVARSLAHGVLSACAPRPLYVACESPDVAQFAREQGASVIESHATNLNDAVTHAYRRLGESFEHLIIAHGDLRDPRGLGEFVPHDGVTVFTDARRIGTNVLALPTGWDFTFRFGADSARSHQREAERLGLEVRVVFESPWRFDVDEPVDLVE